MNDYCENSDDLFSDSDDLFSEDEETGPILMSKQQDLQSHGNLLRIDYYKSMLASYGILLKHTVCDNVDNPKLERFQCSIPVAGNGSGIVRKTSGSYTRYHISARQYGRFTDAKSVKFIAHRLALAVKLQQQYNELVYDASHLCHSVRGCVRPEHIHLETHSENMQRNSCSGFHYYRDSDTLRCYCLHSPKCEFVRTFDSLDGIPY